MYRRNLIIYYSKSKQIKNNKIGPNELIYFLGILFLLKRINFLKHIENQYCNVIKILNFIEVV
jgi:hypothetical protein